MIQLLFFGGIGLLFLLLLLCSQAPPVTGVSSSSKPTVRQGKKVRIGFLGFFLHRKNLLTIFHPLHLDECYILLTQSMYALRHYATVEQFELRYQWTKALDERYSKSKTEHVLKISPLLVAISLHFYRRRPHQSYLTWHIAKYMLLNEIYQTIEKTIPDPTQIIEEPEPEEIEEHQEEKRELVVPPQPKSEPVPAIIIDEEPDYAGDTQFMVEEEPEPEVEEPEQMLTLPEYLKSKNLTGFLACTQKRLLDIYGYYVVVEKITQADLLDRKILNKTEWSILFEAGKGILWHAAVIDRIEGDLIINVQPDELFSLVEAWIQVNWQELCS